MRTVGGKGEGPGEFLQAGSVGLSRDGRIWVMGMGMGSVSIFDTAGTSLRDERTKTPGMVFKPYRGGFDPMGRYNVIIPDIREEGDINLALARFDQSFTPIDTIPVPDDPVERDIFRMVSEEGMMRASVPFQGALTWRFSRVGHPVDARHGPVRTHRGRGGWWDASEDHEGARIDSGVLRREGGGAGGAGVVHEPGREDRPFEDPRVEASHGALLPG